MDSYYVALPDSGASQHQASTSSTGGTCVLHLQRYLQSLSALALLCYTGVVKTALQSLSCVQLPHSSHMLLVDANAAPCHLGDPGYKLQYIAAWTVLLMYGCGLPVALLLAIRRQQQRASAGLCVSQRCAWLLIDYYVVVLHHKDQWALQPQTHSKLIWAHVECCMAVLRR